MVRSLKEMPSQIRIVFIEDVPAEAVRVEQALRKDGLSFQMQRVETKEDFLRALEMPPDVILSDHGLPSFDGFAALAVARAKCPHVPFLFVTNALTREMEIEKLTPGVSEYVLKDKLHQLAPIIRRILGETTRVLEQQRAKILEKLLPLLEEYEKAGGFLPICSSCKKIRDVSDTWWPPEMYFKNYGGLNFTHGICPNCVSKFAA